MTPEYKRQFELAEELYFIFEEITWRDWRLTEKYGFPGFEYTKAGYIKEIENILKVCAKIMRKKGRRLK